MGVLAWVVLGLVAGLIAKAIYPGRQGGGVISTMVLGIIGALLGGWIGRMFTGAPPTGSVMSFGHLAWAVVGSIVVLFFYGLAGRRRPPQKV